MRGLGHLRAREAAKSMQGVRGTGHLRAREGVVQLQGVRGLGHLRAREAAIQVQGVRGRGHLRAREAAKHVHGVSGLGHLRAREVRLRELSPPSQRRGFGGFLNATTPASFVSRPRHHLPVSRAPRASRGRLSRAARMALSIVARAPILKQRYFCKECEGSGICAHGRRKHGCKECRAARDAAAPVLCPPADPPPEILLEPEDVDDPGEDDERVDHS